MLVSLFVEHRLDLARMRRCSVSGARSPDGHPAWSVNDEVPVDLDVEIISGATAGVRGPNCLPRGSVNDEVPIALEERDVSEPDGACCPPRDDENIFVVVFARGRRAGCCRGGVRSKRCVMTSRPTSRRWWC